jgi:drug/metabolite transporter (DMT)-like permease
MVVDLARGGRPGPVAMTGLVVDLAGIAVTSLAAGGSVLWVALGVQLGALPTTLAGAVRSRRRLGIDDPSLLAPVVTAGCAVAIAAERPNAPRPLGAALAVLGTLIVAAAQPV